MDVASLSLFQWFIVFGTLSGFQMTEHKTIYVSTGADVKIKCPHEKVHIWQYPESNDVLALCENGENRINPKCNVSDRITISSDCQLEIQNFTTDDLNRFICMTNNYESTEIDVKLLIKPAVSINVFINSIKGKSQKSVIVKQGQQMELKCHDNSNTMDDIGLSWLFNGIMIKNYENRILFNTTSHEMSGLYTCIAANKAGNDTDDINITVTYFPIVRSKMITFHKSNRPRSIECEVSGVPETYNFSWSHYTSNKQLVRMFNRISNRKLILPEGDANDPLYEDSGIYVCNVTNGIEDESGKLWQKGEIKVVVEGEPVLAKSQRSLFIGNYNGTSSLSLFVLSSSNDVKATWKNENGSTLVIDSCSSTVDQTLFNGRLLDIAGYQCVYQIQNTQEKDFQSYIVDLRNKNGITTVNISLVSSRAPEAPAIFDVYQRHNDIVLEWKPMFDGGKPQSFIIQYRKSVDEIWKSVFIQPNETRCFVLISNIELNTKYVLRMLAFNRIGNSSFTELYTVLTKDERENVWIQSKFFFLSIAVILPICLIVLIWRYKQDGIGNDPNVSSNRDDVYSSIDSRRQILEKQRVTYKVAGRSKGQSKPDSDKTDKIPNRNGKHDSANLNYVEIAFDSIQPKGKFLIRGNDNRTPYADIDFTAKVDPMISSDESDDSLSLNVTNEDDFVSIEDVQQWKIHSD